MSTTLTIRTDKPLLDALARRAKMERKTVSQVVREILEDAVVERPLSDKVGSLRGSLRIAEPRTGWQRQIRARNWRT